MAKTKDIKSLTDREIRNLKAGERLTDHGDHIGLRIEKGSKGLTSFFYRYRHPKNGKIKQLKLGVYPEMSLSEARVELLLLKSKRASGIDPQSYLNEQKVLNESIDGQEKPIFTINQMVELYLQEKIEDRRDASGRIVSGSRIKKGQKETRRTLERDVIEKIGRLDAEKLGRAEITELVLGIVDRGAPVQAGNVLRELYLAYEYSIGRGRFDEDFTNPAFKAKNALKSSGIKLASQRGKRAFTDDELRKFLLWLPESSLSHTVKNIFLFTLWTGCRTGELCEAEWEHVDFDKGTLFLPSTKTGTSRYVQLPKQALAWLMSNKILGGKYLFPSQKTNQALNQDHLSSSTWHLRQRDEMLDIEHWTPHDLRRTVRTGLARLKVREEVAEAVIGHTKQGIAGTYNLHRYEDECREALQLWADHMDMIHQR
ncbi:site-specific integrase [Photobacterium gaetbulicola]|uniref:Putative prophage integrase n=1 Tax=Photobacterium gaetbulicola Gung47 TaxID=658445 RepID=A0A0C5WK64_9GAMM|nr:site-specific integrase [Photobacterium gaetbulicola]AJR07558.1 putative prophage integrase [Photobacterium gaetbulicola Gung47]PSU04484.1 site-specific integrase [Photobacterium gaetbulicola]